MCYPPAFPNTGEQARVPSKSPRSADGYSLAARIVWASASWRRVSSAVTRADKSGSARTWRIMR